MGFAFDLDSDRVITVMNGKKKSSKSSKAIKSISKHKIREKSNHNDNTESVSEKSYNV